jgi:hypothetical protein
MPVAELLDEIILLQRGRFQRVRRYWRGIHPERGVITYGWTGWETVEECDRVLPLNTVNIKNQT